MNTRTASDGTVLVTDPTSLQPGIMTPRQRQILSMFVGGWTYTEIATKLELSPGTINPTLRSACSRLGGDGRIAREYLRELATEADQLDDYAKDLL